MMFRSLLVALAAVAAGRACPGSPVSTRAKAEVKVELQASCARVAAEMVARLEGEKEWKDPHNNGVYQLKFADDTRVEAQRTTGDGKYTDLMDFSLTPVGDDACVLEGCSESQVTSILDFSTNYCNLHVLYCGSQDKCEFVNDNFGYKETASVSYGAGKDPEACVAKAWWQKSPFK